MKVVFFHRKPNEGNFSIESLFNYIRANLPTGINWEIKEMRFHSRGFFRRLYIGFEAFFHQGDVNHITGDVNFLALFMSKRKTILTVHDVGFMQQPNPFYRFLLLWFWIKLPVKRCALITTVSQATQLELLKYVSINPTLVRVIPVPISNRFVALPKPFNQEEPCILQIGTKRNKNVIRLIKALEGIPCKLEIVGELDEELESVLEAATVKYTQSKNLTDEEILDKYKSADIVSFVSTYEGFGMPIVEANAIGRVVITSRILSMPEVAGNAAHLVDPYDVQSIRDGIIKVITDAQYRNALIANGYLNRQRFSAETIALQYAAIYHHLHLKGSS